MKDIFSTMTQELYCHVCGSDFSYSYIEQKEQCKKNNKYYWWYPKCCHKHQPIYESLSLNRREMNKMINAYFNDLSSLDDTFVQILIYFDELEHSVMHLSLTPQSLSLNDAQKISYIKKASKYNSKNEMMDYLVMKLR